MNKKDWVLPVIVGAVLALVYLIYLNLAGNSTTKSSSIVQSYADQIEPVLPFTVSILSNRNTPSVTGPIQNDPYFSQFLNDQVPSQSSLGSGIIFNKSGWIVTNAHVVRGADNTVVMNSDGQVSEVLQTIIDPETDIAVLQTNIRLSHDLPIQKNTMNRIGDLVFSIGNPFGIGQSVSMGIISAVGRQQPSLTALTDFIQTDAAINPGNSGGALVNARGEVIGMNTSIFSSDGSSQGIGFAIPFDYVYGVANSLVTMGTIQRGYLGLDVEELSPDEKTELNITSGLTVASVEQSGPAALAGVQADDILIEIDGMVLQNRTEAVRLISQLMPGKAVIVKVLREGGAMEIAVTLGTRN